MASIVYQIDKKTGAKYAFESVSYWDKDKKQPRSKRKYLGKVDPETGEIIPSRGRTVHSEEKASEETTILPALYKEIEERDRTIKELRRDLDEVTEKYNELLTTVQKIRAMVELY
jgi:predicted RNase H-like nuclease (RuvC/YqgF family)